MVVDFWADWCGPCKALAPVLEREAEARSGSVVLAKVDVDANQQLAAHYGVSSIPAVKAFRNGQVVSEFVGVKSAQGVGDFLDALSGPTAGERLLEELRESGEQPEVLAALEAGDHERALELLLEQAKSTQRRGARSRPRADGGAVRGARPGARAVDALPQAARDGAVLLGPVLLVERAGGVDPVADPDAALERLEELPAAALARSNDLRELGHGDRRGQDPGRRC